MGCYRKKPIAIEAVQYVPRVTCREVFEFMGMPHTEHECDEPFRIVTLEGTFEVQSGDWVIRGVAGEYYSCKPDIFDATYEPC